MVPAFNIFGSCCCNIGQIHLFLLFRPEDSYEARLLDEGLVPVCRGWPWGQGDLSPGWPDSVRDKALWWNCGHVHSSHRYVLRQGKKVLNLEITIFPLVDVAFVCQRFTAFNKVTSQCKLGPILWPIQFWQNMVFMRHVIAIEIILRN